MKRNSSLLALLLAAISAVMANVALAEPAAVDYLRDVKPILSTRCYACHGGLQQKAGLRLDTVELMLRGGDSGSVIVKNKPDESLLLERVATKDVDERMPPEFEGEPLTANQDCASLD
jgi:hypothetical protein